MANVYATKSGNWSDTTVWNTLALPTTVDNVYSNNFTVYVDISPRVNLVTNIASTGIAAGGSFILNDNISLSALVAGSGVANIAAVQFLSASPFSSTIVGNISSNGIGVTNSVALLHNGTGTLTVLGSAVGGVNNTGSVSNGYIRVNSSGTFNIIGDVLGAGTGAGFYGINNASTGTVNVTGNVTGNIGTANTNYGVINSSTGTVNIRGNVASGLTGNVAPGAINNSTGRLNILGNVISRNSTGAVNNSTGILSVTGNVNGSQTGTNQIGISNNGICIVYGNVAGGPEVAGGAGGNTYGIANNAATSNLTVYGNVSGAGAVTATGFGVLNNSSGLVNILGNVHGRVAEGVRNNSTGTVSITGNVIGGTFSSIHGIQNSASSTGTIIVNGNAIGGIASGAVGIVNNIGGIVIVNGNAIANIGSLSYGVAQNGTGYVEVNGLAIGNGWGLGSSGIGGAAPGIIGSQTGTTIIRGLSCGARGQWPTAGNVFIIPQRNSTATLETSAFQDVTLITSLSDGVVPPVSSVRQGTVYNLGDYRGTCAIPSVSSVLQGVAVDNSVGIAALQPQTIWNYSVLSATDVDSLGGRLKEVATVQSVGQQLTALN